MRISCAFARKTDKAVNGMIRDGLSKADACITSILMVGQSNMAGRGHIGEVDPIVNAGCYMLRMGRWQPMSEPINPDRAIFKPEMASGVGLAASFADDLQKHLDAPVGLIPCADGGTRISQWMPGEVLFDHAVMMTELALRTSKLGGIIWHQGESDCVHGDIERYSRDLITMLTALRRRLNAEHLPLVLGELSLKTDRERHHLGDWPEKVNAALPDIVRALPNSALVSADGLCIQEDGIHFDARSLREMGHRYFEKFISIG